MKSYLDIRIAVIFLLGCAFAAGQELPDPEVRVGIRAGGNVSRVNFDPVITQLIKPGLLGGISFQYLNQRNLGIQLELNYLQSGWKGDLDSASHAERRLHYLQLPFTTHGRIGKGRTRVLLNIGSFASVLLSEKSTIQMFPGFQEPVYYSGPIPNRFDYGLCLGTGLSFDTSAGLFELEARINYSLLNLFKQPPDSPFFYSQNQSAELTLAYYLPAW